MEKKVDYCKSGVRGTVVCLIPCASKNQREQRESGSKCIKAV